MFYFSPMEQFEPVPFFTLYFSDINFSFTNLSITFIYIALVLNYLVNGYFFKFSNSSFLNITHSKEGALNLGALDVNYANTDGHAYSNVFTGKGNFSFLNYIAVCFNNVNSFNLKKLLWLNKVTTSSQNSYSNVFYKYFYNYLASGSTNLNNSNLIANFYRFSLVFINGVSSDLKAKASLYSIVENNYFSKNYGKNFLPSMNFWFFENIYLMVIGLVKETIGGPNRESVKFFPFIFTIFLTILFANVLGLMPYGTTVTAYLIVTLGLTLITLAGTLIIGAQRHGIKYFGHFLPSGCPFVLYPFLIVIELLSYIMRVVSLSVRLFANMFAGHTLLVVICGFGWTMMTASISIFVFFPLPILLVLILVGLETGVAIIQAYVFTMLTCIYIDEHINLH